MAFQAARKGAFPLPPYLTFAWTFSFRCFRLILLHIGVSSFHLFTPAIKQEYVDTASPYSSTLSLKRRFLCRCYARIKQRAGSRRHKLCIAHFRASTKNHSLRCSSSPHKIYDVARTPIMLCCPLRQVSLWRLL